MLQNRGGDIIRKIAGDGGRAPLREIGPQGVGLDELQAAVAGEFLSEMARQMGVDFNRDQALGPSFWRATVNREPRSGRGGRKPGPCRWSAGQTRWPE